MKKIFCLLLVACLVLSGAAALADGKVINGGEERDIQIHPAGDNEVEEGISPTTGRRLEDVRFDAPDGAAGLAVTGRYMPFMVQITNGDGGTGARAPLYGAYADVVYETPLYRDGISRISLIFSDIIPEYAGFVRSTRLTHIRIRQEWDCAYITSGYSDADVPDELDRLGITKPNSEKTIKDPGLIYVTDYRSRPWGEYSRRMTGKGVPANPDNMVAELAGLMENVVPADYVPKNHAYKFTDEKPQGDDAVFVEIKISGNKQTWSRLEYDEHTNTYFRYLVQDGTDVEYREAIPVDLKKTKVDGEKRYKVSGLEAGAEIDFSNVIVQYVDLDWISSDRPDPTLVGSGNADYFMGGKHIAGVWQRDDINDRTVFYDNNGNEIELQRGRTLIVMPDWQRKGSVSYSD